MKSKKLIIVLLLIILTIVFVWKIYPSLNNNKLNFQLKDKQIEVKIGEQVKIEYELNKEADIIWESMNNDVATVNNGIVTGVGYGNTIIKIKIIKDDDIVTASIGVSTYTGEKSIDFSEIYVPDGEIYITKGDSYLIPIEFSPYNAYITSIEYSITDSTIAEYDDMLYAHKVGVTYLTITVNRVISSNIVINVIDKSIEPMFSERVKSVNVLEEDVVLKPGETKKIEYEVSPKSAFVESVEWESSNPNVAYVEDNEIIAKSSGNAIIKMKINKSITEEINVDVSISVSGITLKSDSVISLKVGKTVAIKSEVTPANASNKKINYSSSNGCVKVDENGLVTGIAQGSGSITLKTDEGNHQIVIPFTVNPQKGVISGGGGIWGHTSTKDVVPVRADINFFRNLASTGKGAVSGNTYMYTDSNNSYVYDISESKLKVGNKETLMRIYYPQGVDLSSVNTFTFFGGAGERSFGEFFKALDRDPSLMKTSGIIILVSAESNYHAIEGMNATNFVKSIVNQKSGVRNAVGGYSMSGGAAGKAANDGPYDRLIIFDSYIDNVSSNNNLKNKEVVFFSPAGDSMVSSTIPALNKMVSSNYTDVTIVTNNNTLINSFSSSFLIINPGSQMGTGHGHKNISKAKVFSYACS